MIVEPGLQWDIHVSVLSAPFASTNRNQYVSAYISASHLNQFFA